MIGQTLDRYVIESKLGEGGMGVVYKARDTHLGRDVAIKVLPADKMADQERRQRFVHEARSASALNHPNIVTVHDIGSAAGVDFMVMEYVRGRTLDQMMSAKGLPMLPALRYATQIADALARAHEAGIVHRDLKPSNVMVTDDDRVKVLDFGLAKLFDSNEASAVDATRTSPITGIGTIVGTTAYMSPEQAQGQKVDARSDVFALGAVLYEMVCGRRPFVGDSPVTVLASIVQDDPPPPGIVTPTVTPEIERTILKCLRKSPARRYQTMADLKVALEDLAMESASGPAEATTAARSRSRTWRWAGAALVIIAIGAVWFGLRSRRASPAAAESPMVAVPLAALPGVVRSPSFAPDGNQVVFSWNGPKQDNRDIYVQQVGAGSPLRLTTDPATDHSPAWSPDGRAIAFLRETGDVGREELRLIPPLGGSERKLTEIRPRGFLRPVSLAWCPDSSCVVVTDGQGNGEADALFLVSVESGEKKRLTTPPNTLLADTDPAISPDGRWLVFRRDNAPFSGSLYLQRLSDTRVPDGEPRRATPVLLNAYGPSWLSTTDFLFAGNSSLWRMNISADSTPQRLPFVGQDALMAAVSPPRPDRRSRVAYVRRFQDTNIWRLETTAAGATASSPPVVAISSTRGDEIPQLSPDGHRVTFMSGRSGEWEVWAADVSGTNAIQLSSLAASPGYPRWSPLGDLIAFHSNSEKGPGDIYVVAADGGKPRNLTSDSVNDTFPAFSHDGKWIYFTSIRGGALAIWKIPTVGGAAVQVSPNGALKGIESTDGTALYYVSGAIDGIGTLWRLPLKGGDSVRLAEGVPSNDFDVVDKGVYYLERTGNDSRLRFVDVATRRTTTVADRLGNVAGGLSASRDGRTILFSRVDSAVDHLMLVDNFR